MSSGAMSPNQRELIGARSTVTGQFEYLKSTNGILLTTGTVSVAQPTSPTVTSVGDTTSSTPLIAANSLRKEVEFFNGSTAILYLLKGTGTASATNFTVQLNQGDYYTSDITSAFQGVWASDAGGSVFITEST